MAKPKPRTNSTVTATTTKTAVRDTPFPYVPGLLTFREAPVVLEAFAQLETMPDVIMFDGQGLAHPSRIGLASHLGLWLDVPSFGCAKSLFVGTFKEPGPKAGSATQLKDKGEVIGKVVRTRDGVKPVFVSVGHKIDLDSAVRWAMAAARGCRVPEPTRQADIFVNSLRRDGMAADGEE